MNRHRRAVRALIVQVFVIAFMCFGGLALVGATHVHGQHSDTYSPTFCFGQVPPVEGTCPAGKGSR